MDSRSHVGRATRWRPWAALAAAVLLGACGGSGGSSSSSGLAPSSTYAEKCVSPRPGGTLDPFTGRPYGDVQGTLADEKNWLRSWIDETYLWYQDVEALPAATLDPNNYATAVDYFDVLKSDKTTASGAPKDRFHFTYDTDQWVALSQSGVSYGYGFQVALIAASPPREAVVAYTDPNTTATANGIARGAQIIAVDGAQVADGDPDTLNAGLFPTAPGDHTFTLRDPGAASDRSLSLYADAVTETPVQDVMTLPSPYQNVGYMLFNDHIATSESELINAITQLRSAGISDLVLDIRYNGGGYLDIASELAYMIAGPGQTTNKVFERITFNDKNPFNYTTAEASTPFHSTSQGFSVAPGQALPYLGLSRVYVLTTADTCSASEAIINSLRGVNLTVNLIGGTTCGKPYGFFPADNCSTTYFSIQFQGVNDQGFGDYADGFAPTCAVSDDFGHALGDPAEALLSTALAYRASGSCSAATAGAKRRAESAGPVLLRSPVRENRIYRPR